MSTASGAQSGFTLRIGVVVPFTGASAVFGPAYAKAAGLAVQQAKTSLRRAGINNVKIEIEYADDGTTPGGWRERRAHDDLQGRRLHSRRAHVGKLDRHRPGRDRARACPADRAEQLVAGPHRPQGQRLLLPHHALRHVAGADPRAPDQGGDGRPGRPSRSQGATTPSAPAFFRSSRRRSSGSG